MMRTGISGASRAASRIVSSPWSGISLPTKRTRNGSSGRQPAWKSRSSAPTRHTRTRARGMLAELGEEVRVRLRVGDDEVGLAKRAPVDRRQDRGAEPALLEAPAVADERLVERDERVEDQRPLAGDAPRARDVEVARVADDDGVEGDARRESQPHLGEERAGSPPPSARPSCRGALPRRRACRSKTSTPASRSAEITWALRG